MKKKFSMDPIIKKVTPVLLLSIFLLPLTARAEIRAGSVELSPFAGYNLFEKRQNLENRGACPQKLPRILLKSCDRASKPTHAD